MENMEWLDQKIGLENVVSRHTKKWENYCKIMKIPLKKPRVVWPPNSPDLSGLDFSIWDRVKKTAVQYSKNGFYENMKEAQACIEKAWDALPQSYIDKVLIEGFNRRLKVCRETNGNFVV